MTIDERIEALTMNLELLSHDHEALRQEGRDQRQRIEMLISAAGKDGENNPLPRPHRPVPRRLTELEGGS